MLKSNSRKGKPNKIRKPISTSNYYNYYNKNYVPNKKSTYFVDKKKFKNIIKEFNKLILEEIVLNNYEFKLPSRMGKLSLRKLKPEKKIDKNNNLINRNPIDMKATLALWEKNKEAKNKKVFLRYNNKHSNGFVFFLFYDKKTANYKNKTIYHIKIHRKVKTFINKAVKEYNIDAFLI